MKTLYNIPGHSAIVYNQTPVELTAYSIEGLVTGSSITQPVDGSTSTYYSIPPDPGGIYNQTAHGVVVDWEYSTYIWKYAFYLKNTPPSPWSITIGVKSSENSVYQAIDSFTAITTANTWHEYPSTGWDYNSGNISNRELQQLVLYYVPNETSKWPTETYTGGPMEVAGIRIWTATVRE